MIAVRGTEPQFDYAPAPQTAIMPAPGTRPPRRAPAPRAPMIGVRGQIAQAHYTPAPQTAIMARARPPRPTRSAFAGRSRTPTTRPRRPRPSPDL